MEILASLSPARAAFLWPTLKSILVSAFLKTSCVVDSKAWPQCPAALSLGTQRIKGSPRERSNSPHLGQQGNIRAKSS